MRYTLLFAALSFSLMSGIADADALEGNINVTLGAKSLNKEYWEPVETQKETGIRVDLKGKNWPVSIAIDWSRSSESKDALFLVPGLGIVNANVKGITQEWNLGVRKIFEAGKIVRPYFGGGIAFVKSEIEAKVSGAGTGKDDDFGTGYWLGGGVYWSLNKKFNIGADLRYSKATVTMFELDGKAGGTHFGFLAGYHW